ncbi:MAG: CPBP family glutamic-type intramembrane protease, partial [Terracidiphilus sp.]
MDPENLTRTPGPGPHAPDEQSLPGSPTLAPEDPPFQELRWIFIGDQGLRVGWSVAIFYTMFRLISYAFTLANRHFHFLRRQSEFTASSAFSSELVTFLMVLFAVGIVALIEHRSLLDFNLRGPGRVLNFFSGLIAGFLALSTLVWAMDWGGWLHFGPHALSGPQIFQYAALWGAAFLLVGFVEEGVFRCFFQATLTRGLNFWWALACICALCLRLALHVQGNGVWGVYVIALLGLVPCALLHVNKVQSSGFWQAAWVTSTTFGFIHTGNNGENWIGIFAAAFIGFVFCVSVWVT